MNRKRRRAQAAWQRARRAVDEAGPGGDPGRALLMAAAEQGYLTPAEVESLDAWGGRLATELIEGRLSEAEIEEQVIARLKRDFARRGQA